MRVKRGCSGIYRGRSSQKDREDFSSILLENSSNTSIFSLGFWIIRSPLQGELPRFRVRCTSSKSMKFAFFKTQGGGRLSRILLMSILLRKPPNGFCKMPICTLFTERSTLPRRNLRREYRPLRAKENRRHFSQIRKCKMGVRVWDKRSYSRAQLPGLFQVLPAVAPGVASRNLLDFWKGVPDVDLHMQMISTIPGAEDLYPEKKPPTATGMSCGSGSPLQSSRSSA